MPGSSGTVYLNSSDSIKQLIRQLREAMKICLHRGGNKTITIHDCYHDNRKFTIEIDLTEEALRRNVK